jgi:glucans biosynthesis protein
MYHRRPSAWVEPVGGWGEGAVRLVEIPSEEEIHDNVVAFWAPARELAAGDSVEYAYRLRWFGDTPERLPGGRAVSTRVGGVRDLATHEVKSARKFVIDFSRAPDEKPGTATPQGVVTAQNARVTDVVVMENACAGTWRLFFHVWPEQANAPVELRAFLKREGRPPTETWTSLWIP